MIATRVKAILCYRWHHFLSMWKSWIFIIFFLQTFYFEILLFNWVDYVFEAPFWWSTFIRDKINLLQKRWSIVIYRFIIRMKKRMVFVWLAWTTERMKKQSSRHKTVAWIECYFNFVRIPSSLAISCLLPGNKQIQLEKCTRLHCVKDIPSKSQRYGTIFLVFHVEWTYGKCFLSAYRISHRTLFMS